LARSLKNHFATMILPELFHCLKTRWQDDGGKIIKKNHFATIILPELFSLLKNKMAR
jgi:hypothetical protein